MVDTTAPKGRVEPSPPLEVETGAPATEIEVTPAMLRAGAERASEVLDEVCESFCELVAREVYRAMIAAQEK